MTYLYWAIAFVGLLIGAFIARRTKEELVPGKKYFILLERVVLFVLVLFALYNVQFGIWVALAFLLGMLFFYNSQQIRPSAPKSKCSHIRVVTYKLL